MNPVFGLSGSRELFDLLDDAPDGLVVVDSRATILGVNQTLSEISGYACEQLVGMTIAQLEARESPADVEGHTGQMFRESRLHRFTSRWRRADGNEIDVEVSARASPDGDKIVAFVRDITGIVRNEANLIRSLATQAFLVAANEAIARGGQLNDIYRHICDLGPRHDTVLRLAWIGLLDDDTGVVRVAACAGEAQGYVDGILITVDPMVAEGRGPIAVAMRELRPVVIDDFTADPRTAPWHERAGRFGLRSSIAVPLTAGSRLVGALALYAGVPGHFDRPLVDAVDALGKTLSQAIDRDRDAAARQAMADLLERNQVNLHAILDVADESIAMIARDGTLLAINETGARRLGGSARELSGKSYYALLSPGSARLARQNIDTVLASGVPVTFEDTGDGRIMRVRVFPVGDRRSRVVTYATDVTESVRSQVALAESRERLTLALEGAHESIWELNLDTGEGYWSPEFYASLGYADQEFSAGRDSWLALMHPDDRERTEAAMANHLAAGDVYLSVEFRFRNKSGEWRWINGRGKVIERTADGRPVRLAGTNVDVTARHLAEQATIMQAERANILLRLSERASVLDEKSLLDYGMEEAERLTGSEMGFLHFVNDDQETLTLVTWTARTRKQCQAVFDRHYPISQAGIWAESFRQRRPVEIFDYAKVASPGKLPPGHAPLQRLISVPLVEGNKVRIIAGVGNKQTAYDDGDISFVQLLLADLWRIITRKRAEAQLRTAVAVVEASPVVSFRWRASEGWPVDFVSSNIERWGYEVAEVLAGTPSYRSLIHPDDIERVTGEVIRYSESGKNSFNHQYRVLHGDGYYFWVDDHTRIVRDERGRIVAYDGVVTDIDAQKQSEETLRTNLEAQRELNRKLEDAQNQLLQSEKMASIGQLAAGVAHELNNPIGFVHSNLGTLDNYLADIFAITDAYAEAESAVGEHAAWRPVRQLKEKADFAFLREDIRALMSESREGLARVKKIVQDLKDFSRVGETNWQWADLHKGIDSTLNIVWNELKYKCTVTKDYAPDLPSIRCLPSQLNQVIMNLLVNAAHAIAERGEITIRTRRSGDAEVQILVSDTGQGIAREHLSHIFDPFFTTKPVGKGTGLGLSIAWGIIGKHHGRIEVQSTVGKGTTFTITLPIDPPADDDAAVPPAPTSAESGNSPPDHE